MILIFLVFSLALANQSAPSQKRSCPFSPQEEPASLQQFLEPLQQEDMIPCMQKLIQNGWVRTLNEMKAKLDKQQTKILMQLLTDEIKRLQALEESVILRKSTCQPVIKWAQNISHIFVAVKLSHRWDSPPCTATVAEDYSVINRTFIFENVCLVSNEQITFKFNFTLFNSTQNQLEVKKDGVGTYSVTIRKEDELLWPILDQSYPNHQIWEEIMERNETFKRQFEDLRQKLKLSTKKTKNELYTFFTLILLVFIGLVAL